MEYKKYSYILVLILTLVVGINKTYADSCYYQSSDKKTLIEYSSNVSGNTEIHAVESNVKKYYDGSALSNRAMGSRTQDMLTQSYVDNIKNNECPNYIIYRNYYLDGLKKDDTWGFTDYTKANTFYNDSVNEIKEQNKTNGNMYNNTSVWMVSKTTKETFDNSYTQLIEIESGEGVTVDVNCETIFGSKDDPDSLRHLINEILEYPKIIVPILVILLGTIDFATAVISSKEDGMKKAQDKFVKRIIIAVAVFFVPVIIDVLMWLADIVWAGTGYSSCGL